MGLEEKNVNLLSVAIVAFLVKLIVINLIFFRIVACTMRTLQEFTIIMMNQVPLTSFTPKLIYPKIQKKQLAVMKMIRRKGRMVKNTVTTRKRMTRI